MKKILINMLIVVLLIGTINITYANDEETQEIETTETTTAEDLNLQKEELENSILDSEEELELLQVELTDNLIQVQEIDQKIADAEEDVEELTLEVNELTELIDETESELEIANAKYEEQKNLLDTRLIAIYEAGDTKYLDVILNSKSITEFISSFFLISELTTYDEELLEEVNSQKKEIETKNTLLTLSKNSLSSKLEQQITAVNILENTKTLREKYVAKLSEEEIAIQTQIDEYYAMFEEVEDKITELIVSRIIK